MEEEKGIQIVRELEGQVDDILSLYELGEKLHSYQDLHGER